LLPPRIAGSTSTLRAQVPTGDALTRVARLLHRIVLGPSPKEKRVLIFDDGIFINLTRAPGAQKRWREPHPVSPSERERKQPQLPDSANVTDRAAASRNVYVVGQQLARNTALTDYLTFTSATRQHLHCLTECLYLPCALQQNAVFAA
jgi:hypothetical protein